MTCRSSKRSMSSAATAALIPRAASCGDPVSAVIAETMTRRRSANSARRAWQALRRRGIVNLAARGMLVVSVARPLGSEGPLLAYCAAPL